MSYIRKYGHWVISIYIAVIFLDSLRFKFTNAPETQVIFGKLDAWAGTFGAGGIFSQTGLFSQYVIGSAELVASVLILAGLFLGYKTMHGLGALIGVAVMTGAISFHLFTPLGIDPNNDGGGLFFAAIGVWLGSIAIAFMRRKELLKLGCGVVGSVLSK